LPIVFKTVFPIFSQSLCKRCDRTSRLIPNRRPEGRRYKSDLCATASVRMLSLTNKKQVPRPPKSGLYGMTVVWT
jgi:hypothetical protein